MFAYFLNKRRKPCSDDAPAVIYFVPHQDDELLTLGVHACTAMVCEGKTAHAVLCSDGSASGVRKRLGNGKSCPLHEDPHAYQLTTSDFIATRDKEFRASCAALGYAPDHVHIPDRRLTDGQVTVKDAEKLMLQVLSRFPMDTEVCTLSPAVGSTQHKDHRAIGQAAMNLYRKGYIRRLTLFVEPYCEEGCRTERPDLVLLTLPAEDAVRQRIEAAIDAYSLWDPENGRYAVGLHSVSKEFAAFSAAPAAIYHLPETK